ncbi:MAG: sigma-70 family RNA polymerase sigma factor [Planctomycetes bacterium]|nr:sigma-70 family RNA polymerase sigma factor [Planctomycetota bacterium]
MPISDVDLMLSFKAGKVNAFTALVKRHQKPLVNFFYRLVWDKDNAEDLAQEVFVKIYKMAHNYEATAKFTTFMYRVAKNHYIDYCRTKASRSFGISIDKNYGDSSAENYTIKDDLRADTASPQEAVYQLELKLAIESAISSLPDDQRMVFVMSETQGLKYQEIADVLEIPLGTVKSRMHAAVARLRLALSKYVSSDDEESSPEIAELPAKKNMSI